MAWMMLNRLALVMGCGNGLGHGVLSISSTLLSDSPLSSLAARLMIDACCLHSSQQNLLGLIANPVCWNLTSHSGFSQTVSESNEDAISTACTVSIINDQRLPVRLLV